MIYIVSQHNQHVFGDILDDMFLSRRAHYVEGTGWDAVPGDDGWDTDKFDHEQAIYLICIGPGGHIRSSARLIPSTATHLIVGKLTYLSPFLPPASSDIWVIDRFLYEDADPDASLCLACGVIEYALEQAISSFINVGVTERLTSRMEKLGWDYDTLGTARSVSLTRFDADYDALAASRALTAIDGSVLRDKPPVIVGQAQTPEHQAACSLIDEISAFVAAEESESVNFIKALHAQLKQRIRTR